MQNWLYNIIIPRGRHSGLKSRRSRKLQISGIGIEIRDVNFEFRDWDYVSEIRDLGLSWKTPDSGCGLRIEFGIFGIVILD